MTDLLDIRAPQDQEGTRSVLKAWLKGVGDAVAKDEPIVELETDKVAVEIAAPAAGVLAELLARPDDEVAPGAIVARLRPGAAAASPAPKPPGAAPARASAKSADDAAIERRLSPAVRRLVDEHKLDPAAIPGTGRGGRISYRDVTAFLASAAKAPAPQGRAGQPSAPGASRLAPHDSMRRAIARHMVESLAAAPHVTAVFEADFSALIADREARKAEFASQWVALSYTAYVVRACAAAMAAVPQVNSRWREDGLEIFEDVNIGVGVALGDKGLVVPVVHRAQTLDLMGVARRLQDVAERARQGKLTPADVRDGTFSISNHGVSGSLLAAPIIINQPQTAILGVGKLEKRVVVREADGADALAIRPMAYVTLTIDHRALDGHQTNAWLSAFVAALEMREG